MRAAFLALSFLHNNTREDGGKKGSSHSGKSHLDRIQSNENCFDQHPGQILFWIKVRNNPEVYEHGDGFWFKRAAPRSLQQSQIIGKPKLTENCFHSPFQRCAN